MSVKNTDKKNRWRNKTVAFRVSPEEWEQVNTFARLSGLNKQDYLINRVLQRDIVVKGSPCTYKALRDNLANVLNILKTFSKAEEISDELLEVISQISLTLNGMRGDGIE